MPWNRQTLKIKRKICAPEQQVAQLFWDIKKWWQIWTPIQKVKVLYDDELHQEFVLEVLRLGKKEVVRSFRFRRQNDIFFFSPDPPPMMDFHRGVWSFLPGNEKETFVIAEREYSLKIEREESLEGYNNRLLFFNEGFQKRLEKILEVFANHFEENIGY